MNVSTPMHGKCKVFSFFSREKNRHEFNEFVDSLGCVLEWNCVFVSKFNFQIIYLEREGEIERVREKNEWNVYQQQHNNDLISILCD